MKDAQMTDAKSYMVETIDSATGEVTLQSRFLYFEGRPREYRYNAQNGQFNLYGDRVIVDANGRAADSFTFQPIAYRIFEDALFGRSVREIWAELFFIDKDDAVAGIMFNNTSVSELYRMLEPLLYERKSLTDVVITAKPEKIQGEKGIWHIARFSYQNADPEKTKLYKEFVADHRIYRGETQSVSAQHKLISPNYWLPIDPMESPAQIES